MARLLNAVSSGVVAVAVCVAQGTAPPVYLTHVQMYVTADTYEALKGSRFLQDEFSGSAERTIQADGGAVSYTGLYLYGANTYLEIFKAGLRGGKFELPGRITLVMWIDHRTQLPLLRDRLSTLQMRTRRDAQSRPWYDYLTEDGEEEGGVTTFVAGLYPDGVVRSTFLSAGLRYRADRLLHDVTACTVTVSDLERTKMLRAFHAYGYTRIDERDRTLARGPQFTLTMLSERVDEPRVASVEISLNHAKADRKDYQIGDSELHLAGDRATFTFRFPNSAGQ
jgi:hypothetical protein